MDDPYPSYYLIAQLTELSFSYFLTNGLLLVILLIASALASGSEVAFFSLNSEEIISIQETDPKRGKQVADLLANPKKLLSTILILNNLINIGIVTLTTFVTWSLLGMNATGIVVILIQTVGVTFAIVFFGEIVPKVYANQAKIPFALGLAPILSFFSLPFFSLFPGF